MIEVNESMVSRSAHRMANTLTAPEDLAARAMARGVVVRRRRRVVAGAVGVSAAAAAVLAAIQLNSSDPDDGLAGRPTGTTVSTTPGTSESPPTMPVEDPTNLAGWLDGLPVGTTPGVPYTTSTELVDGQTRVPLPESGDPTEHVQVIARAGQSVADGWIVTRSVISGDGSGSTTVGRLELDGSLQELISLPAAAAVALAPDDPVLAVSASPSVPGDPVRLLELTDGTEITTIPLAADERLVGWSASGLVVAGGPSARLVQTDHTSTDLPARAVAVLDPVGDLAVLYDADGCGRAVVLSAPGEARAEFCDGPGTVSPDGGWRVGTDSPREGGWQIDSVLELATGATSRLPLPEGASDAMSVEAWEDPDTILLSVSFQPDDDRPYLVAVVRCSVRDLSCESALPPLPYDNDQPPYDLSGSG